MTNHKLQISNERPTSAKRRRVLAAVAQEIVTSEDDDNVADGMDTCDILENNTLQHRQTATSSALHALGETIRNTLLEINDMREKNRERRHRELLQILSKMVQQESPSKTEVLISKVSNVNEILEVLNNSANKHVNMEKDFLENGQFCNTEEIVINPNNSEITKRNSNEVLTKPKTIDIATTEKTATKYINILPKSQTNNSNSQSLAKITSVIPIKQNNTKEELQKMRSQMLELQRKKMEDRERKKREFLQMQNI